MTNGLSDVVHGQNKMACKVRGKEKTMREIFRRELIQTGYVHSPLPLHQEKSLEAEREGKEIVRRRIIWDGGENMPSHSGIGTMERAAEGGRNGQDAVRVRGSVMRNTLPYEDGANAHLFQSILHFGFPGENWEEYNRIVFWVKPDSMGSHSVHLSVHIRNEGTIPIPDPYMREGQHLVNLVNHE